MKIVTKNVSNNSGRSQILTKGGGKQKTVNVEQAKGLNWNHGNAAGELALKLGLTWHNDVQHEMSEDGTQHTFIF